MARILYLALGVQVGLYFTVLALSARLRRARELSVLASEHGCKRPRHLRSWDIFGVSGVFTFIWRMLNECALKNSTAMFEKLGDTYTSGLLGMTVIFTCDPQNIKHALLTRFEDWDASRGVRDHFFKPLTGQYGIFGLDGSEWHTARRIYRNQFSNVRKLLDTEALENCFQGFKRQVLSHGGDILDLQPLVLDFLLDNTTTFALGEPAGALEDNPSPENKRFITALKSAKRRIGRDSYLGPIHALLSKKAFYDDCSTIQRHVTEKVALKLEMKQVGLDGNRCLIDGLLENSSSIAEVRDGVTTILVAGVDSVASLLTATLWLLTHHSEVTDRLREEILATCGYAPPTYDQMKSLVYLREVLNETMRLIPPVPFNARTANADTWLPVGGGPDGESAILVKKGQRLVFSSYGSHRSVRTFGMDSHVFRPRRWEDLKASPPGFIPFNLGPRACPGQKYALMEASYFMVRLLQSFSKIESRDNRDWTENLGINLFNKHGVKVSLGLDPAAQAGTSSGQKH